MNILVLESSPHKKGSSNLLAEYFIKGAKESGHNVKIFDVAHSKIEPCLGCGHCSMSGVCIQKDEMIQLSHDILSSDMIVFVTPLYYFGMSAQLKKVIDRFYAINTQLSSRPMKTALIVSAWDSNEWTMKDIQSHYQTLCQYLDFEDMGTILGVGCGTVDMTQNTNFPYLAYEFGKSL